MISASTVLKLEKDPPQSSHFGGPHHRRETTRSPSTIGKLRVCSIDLGHSFQFHPHKLSPKYILNHFFVSSKWICMVSHNKKQLLYFEWSPPWHVGWSLSGEGCHWEYDGKNGEFENIDFRFPWLSDTSEMGFGHDVPFLNYSDRLPHPSDLCQPDRVRWG